VLADLVLYSEITVGPCYVQLSNISQGPTCWNGPMYDPSVGEDIKVAPTGDKYFYSERTIVSSYAAPSPQNTQNTRLLTLFLSDSLDSIPKNLVYADGWLYIYVSGSRVVRVPTTAGRLPQDVLPEAIVTRLTSGVNWTASYLLFAADAATFYWVQSINLTDPRASNQAQYIFSAPLPRKPCDADLPCADSTQTCSNGFCG